MLFTKLATHFSSSSYNLQSGNITKPKEPIWFLFDLESIHHSYGKLLAYSLSFIIRRITLCTEFTDKFSDYWYIKRDNEYYWWLVLMMSSIFNLNEDLVMIALKMFQIFLQLLLNINILIWELLHKLR